MSGWTTAELADLSPPDGITDGPFGSNLKTAHYTAHGPRVIRLQNVGDGEFIDAKAHISIAHFDRLRKHETRAGDLVVALLGDVLPRACVVPPALGPAIVKADCARVRVDDRAANSKYVCFALNRERLRKRIAEIVHGVGRPRITLRELRALEIPTAPRDEQDRIVAAIEEQLSRVDAGVEALERVKKELARYRASVLKAACEGRLVPTEAALARAEGRPYEPASELLARILSERRARWDRKKKYAEPAPPDTSSLPALPEGWVWGTVEQVSVGPARNGLSIKGSDTPPGVAALKLDAMTSRGLNFAAVRYLPIAWQEVSDLKIEAGDFFVSRGNGSKALVGRASVAQRSPGNVIFPDTMIRVRPHRTAQPWLRELWASHSLRVQIEAAAKTTAGIWKISQQDIAEFVVPLPPLAEQHRIVAEVERRLSIADEVAASVDSALARAVRLRQSILKRAFEGKLVPQDPNDEPASVLLARIRAERGSAEAKPRRKSARM